jgi:flagellar biosynthesis GTPase FlhF
MPKNEDGEFELILGNKQLLSVFFIVVILLGVFFAMGFIVGRNSPAPVTDAVVRKGERPTVVDSASRQPDPIVVQSPPKETAVQSAPAPLKSPEADKAAAAAAAANAKAAEEERLLANAREEAEAAKARQEAEKKSKEKAKEKAKVEEERPKSKKEAKAEAREKAKKESAKADRGRPVVGTPSGTYLQLAATTQHEAEAMVDLLRRKEFRSIASEVPEKPGLYRVLVGPLSDSGVGKSRSELSAAGFPGDKAIKRSY